MSGLEAVFNESGSNVHFEPYLPKARDKCSVWFYFLRDEKGEYAKCKSSDCGNRILKTGEGSTSCLRSHLRSVHKVELPQMGTRTGYIPQNSIGADATSIITENFDDLLMPHEKQENWSLDPTEMCLPTLADEFTTGMADQEFEVGADGREEQYSEYEPPKSKSKKAKSDRGVSIWEYYLRSKDGKSAKCKNADCGHTIIQVTRGSTTGLRKHLMRLHKFDPADVPKPKFFKRKVGRAEFGQVLKRRTLRSTTAAAAKRNSSKAQLNSQCHPERLDFDRYSAAIPHLIKLREIFGTFKPDCSECDQMLHTLTQHFENTHAHAYSNIPEDQIETKIEDMSLVIPKTEPCELPTETESDGVSGIDPLSYNYKEMENNDDIDEEVNTDIDLDIPQTPAPAPAPITKTKINPRLPQSCSICKQVFLRSRDLITHFKTEHQGVADADGGNVKPFACKHCSHSFKALKYLNYHEKRVHALVSLFVCELCGKGFNREYALYEHSKVHSGEKSYMCGECGKLFSTNRARKQHEAKNHNS